MKKKIFLLGDVVRHVYLKPVDKTNTPHEKKGEYKVFTQKMELTSETTEEQNKDLKNEKKDLKIECSPIIKRWIQLRSAILVLMRLLAMCQQKIPYEVI